MTLKQQIHDLVEELPDKAPLLVEVRETLRMNHSIGEAMNDVREGRTFSTEEFMAKVQGRWPRKASAKFSRRARGAILREAALQA